MTNQNTGRAEVVHPDYYGQCAQCGNALTAPEWSEQTSPRSVRHLWCCTACDYQFETIVYFAEKQAA
jgi:hypothetical protein